MVEDEPSDDVKFIPFEEWQKEWHEMFVADEQRSAELYREAYRTWFAEIDLSSITVDKGLITRLTEWEEKKNLDK